VYAHNVKQLIIEFILTSAKIHDCILRKTDQLKIKPTFNLQLTTIEHKFNVHSTRCQPIFNLVSTNIQPWVNQFSTLNLLNVKFQSHFYFSTLNQRWSLMLNQRLCARWDSFEFGLTIKHIEIQLPSHQTK
jgi:hypothetical protein